MILNLTISISIYYVKFDIRPFSPLYLSINEEETSGEFFTSYFFKDFEDIVRIDKNEVANRYKWYTNNFQITDKISLFIVFWFRLIRSLTECFSCILFLILRTCVHFIKDVNEIKFAFMCRYTRFTKQLV